MVSGQYDIEQAGLPRGIKGRILGYLMGVFNAFEYNKTIPLLNLKPTDAVLEIGFGHGAGFLLLAKEVTQGQFYGIDHSEEMVTMALKRNRKLVRKGRLKLMLGEVEDLHYPPKSFDKIFSINCIYFWREVDLTFNLLKSCLRENGMLSVTVRKTNHPLKGSFTAEKLKQYFETAGFKSIKIFSDRKNIIVTGLS